MLFPISTLCVLFFDSQFSLTLYFNANIWRSTVVDFDDGTSHTSVIREHYMFLLETLDVKVSGLVGQLYSDHVISAVERDDISAEQTSFRANEKLLSVLSRKSPQQFQLFLDALDNCGQRHVRNVINDRPGLTTIFTHSLFSSSFILFT